MCKRTLSFCLCVTVALGTALIVTVVYSEPSEVTYKLVAFLLPATVFTCLYLAIISLAYVVRLFCATTALSSAESLYIDLQALTYVDEGTVTKQMYDGILLKHRERERLVSKVQTVGSKIEKRIQKKG